MTTIDRARFAQDLSSARLSLGSLPAPVADALTRAGLGADELEGIAGADHVLHGRAEYERLYDRLVELEARDPRSAAAPIDHARALYEAARGSAAPTPGAAPAGVAAEPAGSGVPGPGPRRLQGAEGPAGRGRATGIGAPRALLPRFADPAVFFPPSELVRARALAAAQTLEGPARRSITSPEADAERRLRTLGDVSAERLVPLEARARALEPGSSERSAVEAEIDRAVADFDRQLDAELAAVQVRSGGGGGGLSLSAIVGRLPPYLQEAVRREGVVIPGVPGAIAPRFSGTPGADWKVKF